VVGVAADVWKIYHAKDKTKAVITSAGGWAVELFEALVDLVASPPPVDQLRHTSLDDWSTLLVEVAGTLGKRHPDLAIGQIVPLLESGLARSEAIDILGSVGDMRAIPDLDRLVQSRRLAAADMIHLVGALGKIGGEAACRLLRQLREAATPDQRELLQELDVALQIADCKNGRPLG
jgi:HEAT repeat protein